MRSFRLIPDDTRIPFVRHRYWAYAFSGALVLLTLILLPTKGLNFGIDFRGGILIEAGMPTAAPDLAAMRASLDDLGMGEVALQEFGNPSDILIRVEHQAGGEQGQIAAVDKVKAALAEQFGQDVSYRRVEFVGPKVSADLLWAGTQATVYALIAILVYIWFRFEWQFAVGAVVALIHDAVTTIGLFSLLGLEFNLASIAAILTIIGYSINETLARTVMTSFTTLLALLALLFVGGPVVRGFTIAMIWGVVIGTYSTIYVASPMVLHLHLAREPAAQAPEAPEAGAD